MSADTEAARLRALVEECLPEMHRDTAKKIRSRLAAIPEAGEGSPHLKAFAHADGTIRRQDAADASTSKDPLPFSPDAAKAASDALGWEWDASPSARGKRVSAFDKTADGNPTIYMGSVQIVDGEPVLYPARAEGFSPEEHLALLHGVHLLEKGR